MVLGLFLFLRPGSVPRFPSLSFKLADHHRQQVQQIFGHFGLLFQKSDYFFGLIGIGISSFLFHCLKKVLFHQSSQLFALGVIGARIYIRYHAGLCMAGIPLHGFYIAFAEFSYIFIL